MGRLQDERQLAAAERCVEAILAAGTTRLGVEELRAAAGVSKRTFHRYFPYKAQAIRPYYAAMTAALEELVAADRLPTVQAWTDAWAEVVLGEEPARRLELFRLIRSDPEFWSVFLEVIEDSERTFAAALRSRPGGPGIPVSTEIDADVVAVGIAASSRLALHAAVDRGADPVAAFAAYLRAFAPSMGSATEHPTRHRRMWKAVPPRCGEQQLRGG